MTNAMVRALEKTIRELEVVVEQARGRGDETMRRAQLEAAKQELAELRA